MDVSTRLLTLVGAALTDLHGRDLHDALPWWQAATESPQLVAGRWLSAEPLTMSRHLVVWVLVDRTAEVRVAARSIIEQHDWSQPSAEIVRAVLVSNSPRDLCAITGLPLGTVLRELARMI